jgi:hypothetical protein
MLGYLVGVFERLSNHQATILAILEVHILLTERLLWISKLWTLEGA